VALVPPDVKWCIIKKGTGGEHEIMAGCDDWHITGVSASSIFVRFTGYRRKIQGTAKL
jgi:hypothetical protein